ncbi:hypothetical protein [Bacillus altitudinis]|uniref:hypothetical protein n=1 Tax=Bacillus altitudinis TaxID=293387 RepID=UPI00064C851D|nr:hypothetical protein [Bacillus altitudinis]KLV15083.1 hypothetical protein ABW03_19060 [Bacillus altitudinis]
MRKKTILYTAVRDLIRLIDIGHQISVGKVVELSKKSELIQEIQALPDSKPLSLSAFSEQEISFLEDCFYELHTNQPGQEKRKFGVENNGLNLVLVSFVDKLLEEDNEEEL